MPLMPQKYFFMMVGVILLIVFAAGYLMSGQSLDINGCRASWSQVQVSVPRSELCLSESCQARPAEQQHNAIVEAMLCACDSLQEGDQIASQRIEEVFRNYFIVELSASQICGSEGQQVLVRRAYG